MALLSFATWSLCREFSYSETEALVRAPAAPTVSYFLTQRDDGTSLPERLVSDHTIRLRPQKGSL